MKFRRAFLLFIVLLIAITFFAIPSFADSSQDASGFQGGFHLGFSPYLGIIGAELQKGRHSITIGVPASIGLRYYFKEQPNNWFVGAHLLYYVIDEEETKDGIRFDEKEVITTGLGLGHKWRFKNHWDLTFSISIIYNNEELRNSLAKRIEESIGALPGLTIGYTF